jgi:hypothetical protein
MLNRGEKVWIQIMPEFLVRFDKPLPADIDEYVDLSALVGPESDERCAKLGLKSLMLWDKDKNPNGDFGGMSFFEHEAMNNESPPEYHVAWSDDLDNWYDCADGVLWCERMIGFVSENPKATVDHPSGLRLILSELNALHRLLRHGAGVMARFQVYLLFE